MYLEKYSIGKPSKINKYHEQFVWLTFKTFVVCLDFSLWKTNDLDNEMPGCTQDGNGSN